MEIFFSTKKVSWENTESQTLLCFRLENNMISVDIDDAFFHIYICSLSL